MGRLSEKKRRNFILVFFILLITVLSLLILREVSRRDILKAVLENSLGKMLQKDVELIGTRIVFYPEFAVEAIGATIKGTDDSPPITIKKLSLNIDLTGLFRGRPTIGELTVIEPTFFLEIETDTKFNLIDPSQMENNLGIAKFFVRKINITGGRLFIKDNTIKDSPLDLEFNGIKIALESSLFRKGISFNFISDMVHDDTVSKLRVKGRVAIPKNSESIQNAFWIIDGDFTSLDTNIFINYLAKLPNLKIPKGTLKGDFNYRGSLSSTFSLFGYVESSDIEIIYPPYYREPLRPNKANVFVNILYEKELLNIREFELGIDEALFAGDLKISSPPFEERTISGHLTSHWFSLPWLHQYLPKGESGFSTLSYLLEEYVRKGNGKIKNAVFYGNIKDFSKPFLNDKKPILLEIALRDLDLNLKDSSTPLSNVSGEFQLEGNKVSLKNFNGTFGKITIKKLAGNISGITTPKPQVNVAFNSSLNFSELENLLSSRIFPDTWKKRLNSFSGWKGTSEMNINLETTLGEKKEQPKFKIISSITDLGFNYDSIDLPFEGIEGTATITNTDFKSEFEGFLGNSSIEAKTFVSEYANGNPTIDIRGSFIQDGDEMKSLLHIPKDLVINGWTPGSFSAIGRLNKTHLKVSLDLTSLEYGSINRFIKPQGLINSIEIEGVYEKPDRFSIFSTRYRLNGEEINLKGEFTDLWNMRGSLAVNIEEIDLSKIKETLPFSSIFSPKGVISGKISLAGSFLGGGLRAKGDVKLQNLAFSMSSTSPPVKNLTADISFDETGVDIPYLYIHRAESILKVSANVKNFSHPQATFKLSSPNFRKADFPPNEFIRALVRKFLEKTSTIKGDIELDQINLKSFNASFLKTRLSFNDGKWRASPLEFYSGGSKIEGWWEKYPISKKDYKNVLSLNISKGNVEKLTKEFLKKAKKIATGTVDAKVNVSWEGKDKDEVLKTLKGRINTKFQNGRIYKLFEVLPKLLALINPLRIMTLDLKEFEDRGMLYNNATADFIIENRHLETNNLIINGKEMKILWLGNVDIKTLEIDSIIALQPFEIIDLLIGETVGRIPFIGRILIGKDRKLLVLYYKVTGDLRNPDVKGANIEEITKGINDRLRTLLLQPE